MSTREKIATDIAEAYLGRPVDPAFLNGPATGGSVFYACADAALAAIGKPDKGVLAAVQTALMDSLDVEAPRGFIAFVARELAETIAGQDQ